MPLKQLYIFHIIFPHSHMSLYIYLFKPECFECGWGVEAAHLQHLRICPKVGHSQPKKRVWIWYAKHMFAFVVCVYGSISLSPVCSRTLPFKCHFIFFWLKKWQLDNHPDGGVAHRGDASNLCRHWVLENRMCRGPQVRPTTSPPPFIMFESFDCMIDMFIF